MISIHSFMDEKLVLLDTKVPNKQALLEEMISMIASVQSFDEKASKSLRSHLLEREAIGSTSLGRGFAVPHAYFEGLEKTLIAFARLETPIDYQAPDGRPVSRIFLIAGPKRNNTEHLMILARLSHLLKDSLLLDSLESVRSGKELLEAIDEAEKRH